MKFFIVTLRLNLKIFLYYRWAFLVSIIIEPIMFVLIISIFTSIYIHNPHDVVAGYTYLQMVWYFAAIRFFTTLVVNYQDFELSNDIISGNMVIKLNKPMSVMRWYFAKAVAQKIFSIFLVFLPVFLIYISIVFPNFLTAASFLRYTIVIILAFILFFMASFFISTTGFILKNTGSLQVLNFIFLRFAAGALLPFEFFPEIIRDILNVLPFKYLCYIPNRFLLNTPETQNLIFFLQTVFIQCIWIAIFYVASKLYWSTMIKKFTAVGC